MNHSVIEVAVGQWLDLGPAIRRVTANNPSAFTGPGTNSYLLDTPKGWAILDPGPRLDQHFEQLIAATEGRPVACVLVTHTHPDHSPAWQAIAQATGAQTLGGTPVDDMFQDKTFKPDRELVHDDVLQTPEFSLRAVHTPGHVGNHFCFFIEEQGMMFAGDHIMNGSTVVIIPPSGDMKAYIASLQETTDFLAHNLGADEAIMLTDTQRAAITEAAADSPSGTLRTSNSGSSRSSSNKLSAAAAAIVAAS